MANEHDVRYRKLFSNPRIMRELLVSFVNEEWVRELDFGSAERLDRTFVTESFRERESDLIWKLPFRGTEVYLYLLIEFQSSVDRFMALRVLRYLTEFYQFLVESNGLPKDKRLPPVFPLVLYNGEAPWNAPEQLADLIDQRIGPTFVPSFRYFKLAENEISTATLEELNNLVAALFMVETMDPEELSEKVSSIVRMLSAEHTEELALFRVWLANFFGSRKHRLPRALDELKEIKTMLATKLKQKEQEWLQRGRLEGETMFATKLKQKEQEWLQRGRLEGETMFATKLKQKEQEWLQRGRTEGKTMFATKLKQKEQEWLQRGRLEGRENESRETARKLKARGMGIELIAEITGLNINVVKRLRAD